MADWENTFGTEYKNVLSDKNAYFSTTFKKFVLSTILTEKYTLSEIENYGYVTSEYQKLSDKLINSFYEYSYSSESYKNNKMYNEQINTLIKKNEITYSKKMEGINMLRRLDPEKVAVCCKHYFSRVYEELKEFDYKFSDMSTR